jgi:Zn ribbon nucleic-acid-binding protein
VVLVTAVAQPSLSERRAIARGYCPACENRPVTSVWVGVELQQAWCACGWEWRGRAAEQPPLVLRLLDELGGPRMGCEL